MNVYFTATMENIDNELKYRVELLRPGCIACGACAKIVPKYWYMDLSDGKSCLKNSKPILASNGMIIKQIFETNDLRNFQISKECCPVNVIKVYEKASGKEVELLRF